MRDPLGCDNPIAERRYAYAQAAAREADWAAAAEVLEQALELVPHWSPAWFALAEARGKFGNVEGAAEAFRAALRCDPSDAQGAGARLSLLRQGPVLDALPSAYIERLFDDYAPRFDVHLRGELGYNGPELIAAALESIAPGRRFARALDLGCGTGLMGTALRGRVDTLIGVDLSRAMLAKARATGLYEAAEVGEIVVWLASPAARGPDLIVAADALVYIGDLSPVFGAIARALMPGGLCVFSVEAHEGEGWRLGEAMRFAHARSYLSDAATRAGLTTLTLADAATRTEGGRDVPGLIGALGIDRTGAKTDR